MHALTCTVLAVFSHSLALNNSYCLQHMLPETFHMAKRGFCTIKHQLPIPPSLTLFFAMLFLLFSLFVVLWMELRTWSMMGKCSTTKLHPVPFYP